MNKYSILIVEDEALIAASLVHALSSLGYTVPEPVATGEEAIRAVKTRKPDLVLMDIKLIGAMDGIEAAEKIRAIADIPIVYLTAYTDNLRLAKARLTEPYGYIVKPAHSPELKATIEMAMYKHALDRKLKESEEKYRAIFDNAVVGIYRVSRGGQFLSANNHAARILGYESAEELIQSITNINTQIYQDPKTREEAKRILLEKGVLENFEVPCRHKDGHTVWVSFNARLVRDADGNILYHEGTSQDVTDRKRVEVNLHHVTHLYALLSQINQAIIRTREQYEMFRTICQVAVESGQFRMAWIGLADDANDRIKPVAHAGHEDGYLDQILITTGDTPTGRGPTGTAFREGQIITSSDIATEPRMLPWRDEALKRGYRSSAAIPLKRKGKPVGALTLYATEPGFFTTDEQRLLQEIGEDISFALDAMDLETERKQMEEALLKERDFANSVIGTAQAIVLILDLEGHIVYLNSYMEEISGYTLEEVKGKDWFETYLPSHIQESVRSLFRKAIGNTQTRGNVDAIITKDGRERLIEWYDTTLKSADGSIEGLLAIGQDVTERKQAEERIRWLASFPEMNPNPIIEMDAQGTITFANDATQKILKELGLPENPQAFVPEDKDEILRLLREGNISQIYREITLNNETIAENISLNPNLQVVRIYTQNITERKRMEEGLHETAAWLRLALRSAKAGIWDWDFPTGKLVWSPEFYLLFGLSPDLSPSFETWLAVLHPDDRTPAMEKINQSIKEHRNLWNEYRILLPDGNWRWIGAAGSTSCNDAEEPVRMSGVCIDITDRKRAEEALQQANKQLNLLSDITRHDILNQLLVLRGYLELSHDVIDNPEALKEYIKKEQQATITIEEQITFTRDYQNLGVSASAWQNVNANIKEAVDRLPMRAVHVEADPANPEVYADPLFEKVFYNLIDNALRYGGDQMKTIRVSSHESDTSLVIVCEDDGVGITDEDKKKLFRKGFGKHTGLGLFLSREILAITGITITENGEPGKGARFEIKVPKGAWRFTVTGAPAEGNR